MKRTSSHKRHMITCQGRLRKLQDRLSASGQLRRQRRMAERLKHASKLTYPPVDLEEEEVTSNG